MFKSEKKMLSASGITPPAHGGGSFILPFFLDLIAQILGTTFTPTLKWQDFRPPATAVKSDLLPESRDVMIPRLQHLRSQAAQGQLSG